ncbi:hypothetical protein MRB53_040349 [Persea americana]|nr:hypothetical protein MRB53_040349 [Persea americana]
MPALSAFPKSHQVMFEYYVGVILFLEENYAQVRRRGSCLFTMLSFVGRGAFDPKLASVPQRLRQLFEPLCECIKQGNLAGFDAALAAGQDEFVKRRIYLTLERSRDLAVRNLYRKVFLQGDLEAGKGTLDQTKRTRIPVEEFVVATNLGLGENREEDLDRDEVECMIANLIYKNLIKGYISREHAKVVLSKAGAFPGTGV